MSQIYVNTLVAVGVSTAVAQGQAMLAQSEQNRREAGAPFPTEAHPNVDADWAAAGLLIEGAVAQLAESLPNGQRMRTSAAFGALLLGAALLERSLVERGVHPLRVALNDPEIEKSAGEEAKPKTEPSPLMKTLMMRLGQIDQARASAAAAAPQPEPAESAADATNAQAS